MPHRQSAIGNRQSRGPNRQSPIDNRQFPEVLCLGELLIDLVPEPSGSPLDRACTLRIAPGGAPANVAVALTRLGTDAGFIGKVGDDPLGRLLKKTLTANQVDLSCFQLSRQSLTRVALVTNDSNEQQRFLFYGNADVQLALRDIRESYIRRAKFFHFGSISLIQEPSRSATLAAIRFARKHGLTISFDPNLRPPLWPSLKVARTTILRSIELCDVFKVNQSEWEFLFPGRRFEDSFALLRKCGVNLAAMTCDAKGSILATADCCVAVPTRPVKVADTTGAGDGFMAGLLFQLTGRPRAAAFERAELESLAAFGNAVGTLTCTRPGAIPAFPSLQQVRGFIRARARKRAFVV
ncbi:MAG TPA: carbohydrate kinase [Terriglobia bacterium]|nr:carbohydrate kinase [Terriglobia bacterium]